MFRLLASTASYFAQLVEKNASIEAHIDTWKIFCYLTVHWYIGYVFFLFYCIAKGNKIGLNEIPHSWKIIFGGMALCTFMMFYALHKFSYWNNYWIEFLKFK